MLDALVWIVAPPMPTLMVRHSCQHGSCGCCGVQADGRERLAASCGCASWRPSDRRPLANHPVLGLVVDLREFFARFPYRIRWCAASCWRLGDAGCDIPLHLRFEDCIECGLCLSACPVAATSDSYAGPAALAAARRALEEGDDAVSD